MIHRNDSIAPKNGGSSINFSISFEKKFFKSKASLKNFRFRGKLRNPHVLISSALSLNIFCVQDLNFTGFRKILKKHDKLMESSDGSDWREKFVETAPFYTNKQISNFISETEVSHNFRVESFVPIKFFKEKKNRK